MLNFWTQGIKFYLPHSTLIADGAYINPNLGAIGHPTG